jgi:hypothetical protein
LNRAELNNLARDVFGTASDPFLKLSNDQNSKFAGSALGTAGSFAELYEIAALEVAAEYITATKPSDKCGGAPSAACAVSILKPLAERMMRRPMDAELESKLTAITETALGKQLSFDEGLTDSILALFLSPDTLYIDTRVTAMPGLQGLDGYSIAERLALAIWNSVPDELLMSAAQNGELISEAGLKAQIDRMLADPQKGSRFIELFASKFLTLDALEALITKAPPEYAAADWMALVTDMATESQLFLKDAFASNLPLNGLVTARHTFVNKRLADHYGLGPAYAAAGGTGDFVKVPLPESEPRLGLTTQGFFMTRLSHVPLVFRGKEFRLQFMCETLPPPPADEATLAAIDLQLKNQEGKTEDELAAERTMGGCAGCHALMDPLGRAYNAFDSVGRVTTGPSDSVYLDKPLTNSVDAANFLANTGDFGACIVSHVLGPVTNRLVRNVLSKSDACLSEGVLTDVGMGENPGFRDMVVGTLSSELFKTRMVGQ